MEPFYETVYDVHMCIESFRVATRLLLDRIVSILKLTTKETA